MFEYIFVKSRNGKTYNFEYFFVAVIAHWFVIIFVGYLWLSILFEYTFIKHSPYWMNKRNVSVSKWKTFLHNCSHFYITTRSTIFLVKFYHEWERLSTQKHISRKSMYWTFAWRSFVRCFTIWIKINSRP